jgi:hypothetical protein
MNAVDRAAFCGTINSIRPEMLLSGSPASTLECRNVALAVC